MKLWRRKPPSQPTTDNVVDVLVLRVLELDAYRRQQEARLQLLEQKLSLRES